MPLTSNGKIDRKALLSMADTITECVYREPATDIERILQQVWQEVLSKEKISVTDNFFEIGGHSLKATRIVSGVRAALGCEIGLWDVFAHPSIRQLSICIEQKVEPAQSANQEVFII
jgi:acyl carrier protein